MKQQKLLEWIVKNDPRLQNVESTSEAKSILPVVYKYWKKRISAII